MKYDIYTDNLGCDCSKHPPSLLLAISSYYKENPECFLHRADSNLFVKGLLIC